MKRVLILVNHDVVIYNFRKELVERLIQEGYEVIISSPYGERIDFLVRMGCKFVETRIHRHGKNPLEEVRLLFYYSQLISTVKPNVVLTYTVKPTLYGSIAARVCGTPCICNITGLGTAIENEGVMQRILKLMYRFALQNVKYVFFQNQSNLDFFLKNKLLHSNYELIPGSGVNLKDFAYNKPKDTEPEHESFLFVGRVMKDKGIEELLSAAKMIKRKYPHTKFNIVGFLDGDYEAALNYAQERGIIQYWGQQSDVRPFYADCDAVVLPSYHEGMANVLLEASASGRPVIASDIPGCRETFEEGISGFGIRPRSVESLYEAIIRFIQLPSEEKMTMGRKAREKVEREFDRNVVVERYIKIIEKEG